MVETNCITRDGWDIPQGKNHDSGSKLSEFWCTTLFDWGAKSDSILPGFSWRGKCHGRDLILPIIWLYIFSPVFTYLGQLHYFLDIGNRRDSKNDLTLNCWIILHCLWDFEPKFLKSCGITPFKKEENKSTECDLDYTRSCSLGQTLNTIPS